MLKQGLEHMLTVLWQPSYLKQGFQISLNLRQTVISEKVEILCLLYPLLWTQTWMSSWSTVWRQRAFFKQMNAPQLFQKWNSNSLIGLSPELNE